VSPLAISVALFAVLLILLAGGVWIAIAMGVVAWLGLAFFTTSPPEVNLFQAFWGSTSSVGSRTAICSPLTRSPSSITSAAPAV